MERNGTRRVLTRRATRSSTAILDLRASDRGRNPCAAPNGSYIGERERLPRPSSPTVFPSPGVFDDFSPPPRDPADVSRCTRSRGPRSGPGAHGLLFVLLALGLAACGDVSGPTEPEPSAVELETPERLTPGGISLLTRCYQIGGGQWYCYETPTEPCSLSPGEVSTRDCGGGGTGGNPGDPGDPDDPNRPCTLSTGEIGILNSCPPPDGGGGGDPGDGGADDGVRDGTGDCPTCTSHELKHREIYDRALQAIDSARCRALYAKAAEYASTFEVWTEKRYTRDGRGRLILGEYLAYGELAGEPNKATTAGFYETHIFHGSEFHITVSHEAAHGLGYSDVNDAAESYARSCLK